MEINKILSILKKYQFEDINKYHPDLLIIDNYKNILSDEQLLCLKNSNNIQEDLITILQDKREPLAQYFMNIAYIVASRSTCWKHKVGSVIVKNKKIVATGYNGASVGLSNCDRQHCILDDNGKCMFTHAEVNACLQSSPEERENATMYITLQPCTRCQAVILNSGITKVVYDEEHIPKVNLLKNTHVICHSLKEELVLTK